MSKDKVKIDKQKEVSEVDNKQEDKVVTDSTVVEKLSTEDSIKNGFVDDNYEISKEGDIAFVTYKNKGKENLYFDSTDLKKEVIIKSLNHNRNYIKATTIVGGEFINKVLKEDKTLNKVVVKYPYTPSFEREKSSIILSGDRSHTYKGIGGNPDVVKSTIKVNIVCPYSSKISKTFIRGIEDKITKDLLGE